MVGALNIAAARSMMSSQTEHGPVMQQVNRCAGWQFRMEAHLGGGPSEEGDPRASGHARGRGQLQADGECCAVTTRVYGDRAYKESG